MLDNITNFTMQMIDLCNTFPGITFTYQNVYEIDHENILDQWILNCKQEFVNRIHKSFKSYKLYELDGVISTWIDRLSRWYLKLNKQFLKPWNSDTGRDYQVHISVLLHCIETTCIMLAPVIPFKTESIYQRIGKHIGNGSVHLCQMPDVQICNNELISGMDALISIINMGRVLRSTKKVALKKPVYEATICHLNQDILHQLQSLQPYLLQELNVMKISYSIDETKYIKYEIQLDSKKAGKKLKSRMKECRDMLKNLSHDQCEIYCRNQESPILELEWSDLIVYRTPIDGCEVLSEDKITLVLDFENFDKDMEMRYHGKLLVRQIQEHRKQIGLKPHDRLQLSMTVQANHVLKDVLDQQDKYVFPLLKRDIGINTELGGSVNEFSIDIDGIPVEIKYSLD